MDISQEIIGKAELNKGIRIADLHLAEIQGKPVEITAIDGIKLMVEITADKVEVSEGDHYFFSASLIGDTGHFAIVNEYKGEKSNNIFPAQLMKYTIDKWGNRLSQVRAAWSTEEGTNIERYNTSLKAGKNTEQAAASTWTGEILSKLGFSKITKVEQGGNYWIFAFFERP
jgi:hypothetical protein